MCGKKKQRRNQKDYKIKSEQWSQTDIIMTIRGSRAVKEGAEKYS